jgi:O-glycosyl hydrolase
MKLMMMKRGLMGSVLITTMFFSCGGSDDPTPEPPTPPVVVPDSLAITVNVADIKQEMIGFGGALTWYSPWVANNNKVGEISDLMFNDLGIDIIRFKNWYYPENYPNDKTTTNMPDDNAGAHWDATNALYNLAKTRNPDVKILLSSWGPPKSLKSNGKLPEGTLKKDAGGFMYDAFADYWVDVLDQVPFDPDYISIQNEPTYVNAGWTTCEWTISETSVLPGYNTAFDKVYNKVKGRTHVPLMIGPESQDVPKFTSFANVLKDNPNCGLYAFHPYNINAGTSSDATIASLKSVGAYSTKPNMMTEFSDNLPDWLSTGVFIHQALVHANVSAYIYWKLAWSAPTSGEDAAMISMSSQSATGTYKVTPYYYLIKHFAKHVDAGYHRVTASSSNASLYTSAFLSADGKQITVVAINDGSESAKVYFEATGKSVSSVQADQSKADSFYKKLAVSSPKKSISLPAKSITTVRMALTQ